jgi:hypothetical protein
MWQPYLWRPQLQNPDDEFVLEAAGQAEAIVTSNKRDFEKAAARFGVALLPPAGAIRRI